MPDRSAVDRIVAANRYFVLDRGCGRAPMGDTGVLRSVAFHYAF